MIIQWHRKDWKARIFSQRKGFWTNIIDLNLCITCAQADVLLRETRWRRAEPWQKTEWGYEAKLRRRS
jgi:hypothetical protein